MSPCPLCPLHARSPCHSVCHAPSVPRACATPSTMLLPCQGFVPLCLKYSPCQSPMSLCLPCQSPMPLYLPYSLHARSPFLQPRSLPARSLCLSVNHILLNALAHTTQSTMFHPLTKAHVTLSHRQNRQSTYPYFTGHKFRDPETLTVKSYSN